MAWQIRSEKGDTKKDRHQYYSSHSHYYHSIPPLLNVFIHFLWYPPSSSPPSSPHSSPPSFPHSPHSPPPPPPPHYFTYLPSSSSSPPSSPTYPSTHPFLFCLWSPPTPLSCPPCPPYPLPPSAPYQYCHLSPPPYHLSYSPLKFPPRSPASFILLCFFLILLCRTTIILIAFALGLSWLFCFTCTNVLTLRSLLC